MAAAVEEHRWWDREPVKAWAPLAALLAIALQTVAYAGYQAFYAAFGVGADEVGFEYTQTLRRTSAPLALSFIFILLLVSVLGLALALVVPMLRGSESERTRELRHTYPRRALRQAGLVVAFMTALSVILRMFHGSAVLFLGSSAIVALLSFDAWRSHVNVEPSTVSVFLEPRPQRGLRHLLILVAALTIGGSIRDWRLVPVFAVTIFGVDRALSPDTSAEAPSFYERLLRVPTWFVGIAALLTLGSLALGLVAQLDWTFRLAHLDQKLRRVRSGAELSFQPFAPFGLIQPQALIVRVSWIGANAPAPFLDVDSKTQVRLLTYFGHNSGTAVFYDPKSGNVLRLPSGSVYLERHPPDIPS